MKIFKKYLYKIHKILYNLSCLIEIGQYGGRGEVVNAPDCGSGIREFDSHRPPHIRNQLLVYQGVFILLKYIFYRNKNDLKFYEGIFKIKFYRL